MTVARTLFEFLLEIHSQIGSINAIGEITSARAQMYVILEGLSQECESMILLISGKFGSISIEEVESLLLCHETHLYRFYKQTLATVNLAATPTHVTSSSFYVPQANFGQTHQQNLEQPNSNGQSYGGCLWPYEASNYDAYP